MGLLGCLQLLRINDHPINRIAELLPGEWKKRRTGQEEELR